MKFTIVHIESGLGGEGNVLSRYGSEFDVQKIHSLKKTSTFPKP
jgi:hypothetical protein